ncbi:hypothetical protein [Anaerorhabdus furcosa]|uniref:DUF4145 domain-containing protein n=1 Tax=Anaerorhabdus furcosa TaxID=118967 RepID=A0A1T4LE02_9FIRM|nr:hypothetical protein [Anaerorhabdus furcosa]SJZ52714.1 hypothetical protein SAMN02745191_0838 [Anaerorhabdus furcosa]
MAKKKIDLICYVEEKIRPYTLNEKGKSSLKKFETDYGTDLIIECVDTSFSNYIRYDANGKITKDSVENFINKIGGIAYNKNLSPVEAKVRHVLNIVKTNFNYYDQNIARSLLNRYIKSLKEKDYTELDLIRDFDSELIPMIQECRNWSDWFQRMEQWEQEINNWDNKRNETEVNYTDCILPTTLFENCPTYIAKVCKQINCSFDNNLFDCTAVMMRRLLEILLILTFQKFDIENEILNQDGTCHIVLDKIIKNAQNSKIINLSASSKKDMEKYKTLGNFSAHKIWYNCTEPDIRTNILHFRVLIEELMYKSAIKE